MTMLDYFKKVVTKDYFNFKGRAQRKEYWSFILFNFIIGSVLGLLAINSQGADTEKLNIFEKISNIYTLGVFIPSIAVWVRRIHDVGKSGWWLLLAFIPILGAIYLIYLSVKDSEPGDNRFGPNPKENGSIIIQK